ncbi:NPCBM/NEW2 domain-containing protein [bacterium]|nr:NPCBM/NEW2 domain-containing protein [bacterium]
MFISDLQPATATTGWGGAVKKDRSIGPRPLTLRGETFARGMGTSAHLELAYPMKPEYQRFVAVVGIDR